MTKIKNFRHFRLTAKKWSSLSDHFWVFLHTQKLQIFEPVDSGPQKIAKATGLVASNSLVGCFLDFHRYAAQIDKKIDYRKGHFYATRKMTTKNRLRES